MVSDLAALYPYFLQRAQATEVSGKLSKVLPRAHALSHEVAAIAERGAEAHARHSILVWSLLCSCLKDSGFSLQERELQIIVRTFTREHVWPCNRSMMSSMLRTEL